MFCGKSLCLVLITRGQLALFTGFFLVGQTKQQVNKANNAPIVLRTKRCRLTRPNKNRGFRQVLAASIKQIMYTYYVNTKGLCQKISRYRFDYEPQFEKGAHRD